VTWLIVIGIVITFHLSMQLLSKIPAKYRDLNTPRIKSMLDLLYVRGFDGGYLSISQIQGGEVLRVHKYIVVLDQVTLAVHIPESVSEGVGRETLAATLQPYSIGEHNLTVAAHGRVGDFVIPCGSDVRRTLVISEFLLRGVLQLDPEHECIGSLHECDPNPKGHPGFTVRPK
jgi:hypothetical protein